MTDYDARARERTLVELAAQDLTSEGWSVIIDPGVESIPFALPNYRPDLVARRADEGLVVEVRRAERHVSIERFAQVAEIVAKQPGWRFLLVPAERLQDSQISIASRLLTWSELDQEVDWASNVSSKSTLGIAYLTVWAILEGMLRRIGEDQAIPVSQLSARELVKDLYTLGVISGVQRRLIEAFLPIRNALAHGFVVDREDLSAGDLVSVMQELSERWRP